MLNITDFFFILYYILHIFLYIFHYIYLFFIILNYFYILNYIYYILFALIYFKNNEVITLEWKFFIYFINFFIMHTFEIFEILLYNINIPIVIYYSLEYIIFYI